jgi:ADP-ribose pyrophosphatase YjhB (NUDIX family)
MSAPITHFKHCPKCSSEDLTTSKVNIECAECGFVYFFNPVVGLAAFIENDKGEILLIQRGKDPAKGKLAPPGGFADADEEAESALTREVMEETGVYVANWKYIGNWVNHYPYKGITYPVLDFFYSAKLASAHDIQRCETETLSVEWIDKHSVSPESLAFPSMRKAFTSYMEHQQST